MDWTSVAHEFVPDGSLRDLYVINTDLSDWQRVLDFLRASASEIAYTVDRSSAELPVRVEAIFAELQRERNPRLRFDVAGVPLVCHFFTADEIEFDMRPEDVPGPDHLTALLEFMRTLGNLTGKMVLLTPESGQQSPIFRFDPSTKRLAYLPTGD